MTVTTLDLFLFQLGAVWLGVALSTALSTKRLEMKHWYLLPAFFIWVGLQGLFFDFLQEDSISWLEAITGGQIALGAVIMILTRKRWVRKPGEK